MPYRIDEITQRRVQLRLRPLLRPAGGHNATRQGQSSGHAGSDSAVREGSASPRNHWFAERVYLGTPLSDDELRVGVNAGIISGALLG